MVMKSDKWEENIFLSLGSNLGDREFYLNSAIELIERHIGKVKRKSAVYETEPWGNANLKSFLNQVIKVKSPLKPTQLLNKCLEIEKELKRERNNSEDYEDRTIDIDVLFYGSEIIKNEVLKVPHPQLSNRLFVLVPLKEIAAEFEHPVSLKRIGSLLADLGNNESVKRF
jgi:2-amino-4-hydroxy-6-hydroxymethyldihydropteridine diphosphokinase